MEEHKLTYDDLHISRAEIHEAMGYGSAEPDGDVKREIDKLLERVIPITRPRFAFHLTEGELTAERAELSIGQATFRIGAIIARQLRGSRGYALFVATAGEEYQELQHRLEAEGDIVAMYMADSLGSVIAEKTADCMERALERALESKGWKHTNRFSPGYCGWHVSQQQQLFPLFPVQPPCGIRLTDSSLMIPIKSVSGVTGIGPDVRKIDYTCGLCDYAKCYRRKKRPGVVLA